MIDEKSNVNSDLMKNKRKSFLITHKKDLMSLCKAIGGSKGEIFSYLINNMIFTDNTVKVTYKKISRETSISYATVAKSMKEFEDAGLIKRRNGYLMIMPTLLMRGNYQSENRLLREFKEFKEDVDTEYTKKIKSYPVIDENSEVLILNSDPTKGRNKINGNYYSKESDMFWKLIFSLLKIKDPINYGDRLNILKKNKIALWDTMYMIQTVNNYEIQKSRQYNDLTQLFNEYKTLKIILCNGEEAYRLTQRVVLANDSRFINILKLPSSSPGRGKNYKKYEEKLEEWRIINQYINYNDAINL